MQDHYKVIVIGSGPAGEKAALESVRLGGSTLVIEKWTKPGGASVIFGTLPSKSLRETVQMVTLLASSEVTGLACGLDHDLTVQELMFRKNRVTNTRVNDIIESYRSAGVDYLSGVAKLTSRTGVEVHTKEGETLHFSAEKIIIAVGTRPYHPEGVDFTHPRIVDSDTILKLGRIPKSMIICGGGVIGSEYCSIFSKLGTKVTLIEGREQILDFLDSDISATLTAHMKDCDVDVRLGQLFTSITPHEDHVTVTMESGDEISAEMLLYSSGRQGNVDGLGLEEIGVTVNKRSQITVNQCFQTEVDNIYGVGDVIGPPALVSVSNREGRLAAQNAVLGCMVERVSPDIPSAVYTIPEIATIGMREQELKEQGVSYAVAICEFSELARGLIIGVDVGLLKIIYHPTTLKILGVHIIGPHASELIHIGQAVMRLEGTIKFFVDEVMNFPTLAAAYKVAALKALGSTEYLR